MKFNLIFTLLAAVMVFYLIVCQSSSKEAQYPNIILIMADDLGYEAIGANGGTSYNTPNIDQLADNGIRFVHQVGSKL